MLEILQQAQSTGDQWLTYLTGPMALLIFLLVVIYTGVRKMWVFGWLYDAKSKEAEELKKENLELRKLGFTATSAAERSVSAAEFIARRKIEEMAEELDQARKRGEIQ